jgi:putative ABC transport system permease protein
MELGALSALIGQPDTVSTIIFNTDNLPFVREYFKDSQNTATIEDKDATLNKYLAMLDPYMSVFYLLQIMGAAVAFAIIYNMSAISLSERKREYATLRVLGLTVDEICEIMRFENGLLSVIGMALGVPLAMSLSEALNLMMDTTLFSMPTTLPVSAYVSGVVGCAAAIVLTGLSTKNKIKKFDMVEVLKERD